MNIKDLNKKIKDNDKKISQAKDEISKLQQTLAIRKKLALMGYRLSEDKFLGQVSIEKPRKKNPFKQYN